MNARGQRMAKRLFIALVALIATWLGMATESSAVEPASLFSATTFTYNEHHHSAQVTDPATERGPPAAYDRDITHDAVDRTSSGASGRPDDATTPAVNDYDDSARFAQSARGSRVAKVHAGGARSSSDAIERSDVAANSEKFVYRGVARDHPGYEEALRGNAIPRNPNGATSAEAHNFGLPEDLADSPFTSWTRDPQIAAIHAKQEGVILRLPTGQPPAGSPWKFEWSPDQWFEQEVLVRGSVYGAERYR